ncbi:hypothetical protein [Bhargavaea cecembensis]|uniref:hypothetical protein n=1 Tax=Bhargavaea cecembensis TaxID=394098 RepID=UPI0006944DC0|nr:hypothetical protein [Bhargavaea cecembensis]
MWKSITLIYDEVPANEFLGLDLKGGIKDSLNFEEIKYIYLDSYKEGSKSNFYDFKRFKNLLSVELDFTNIKDFEDFEECSRLKRIGIAYARNLQSFNGISQLSEHLEVLKIEKAKRIGLETELFEMKELRILSLVGISPLENLQFLRQFPKLEKFIFVDTNVLDGDMTPLLEHPSLQYAGYMDKRHYNIKSDEMERLLKGKNGGNQDVSK